jgi:hypothetical protein
MTVPPPTRIGSSTVVLQASKRGAPKGSWLEQMLARKPRMLVTVELANKMARSATCKAGKLQSSGRSQGVSLADLRSSQA